MKKIVVTGGLGFIGSNLVYQLYKKNYYVIIIDKLTYSGNLNNIREIPQSKFKFYKTDIANTKKIISILNNHKPIGIFNLAAETHVDRSIDDPYPFIHSNILGVYSILEAIRFFLKKNRSKFKLVHISTDEVYGDIKKNYFSFEKDTYKPSSPYAASKASSDHLVNSYFRTYKLPIIITNCSNNYGPKQYPEKLIPKLILNGIKNSDLPIYGKGKNEREWIHVSDHCDALIKVFERGKVGENYNIGSGEVLNNNFIAKLVLKLIKEKNILSSSKIKYVTDRPGHDVRYALNSNKIKRLLNWKKKYKIQNGLSNTIEWYLNNVNWVKKIQSKNYKKRLGLGL